ncbi:MAG TPA: M48 family metalloprotease, partial [Gammaproteobacteria bacterium]|nr:M48 family metalloprotease [Gammaproteobacteria bacterium]
MLALLAVLAGCATNPVTGDRDFVLLSEQQEIRIGRQEHPKILEHFGRYPDEALQEYVQAVGDELAAHGHRKDLIYRFTVLDSPDVNAFALPGGYIYITRGLMAYLDTEAELAAVLGHELGHVTARHSVQQMSAAQAMDLGFTLGSIFAPELRNRGVQDLFNVLGTALIRGYGREHELEADRLGARYLARTGRDPRAMLEVLRVLKAQEEFERQRAEAEGREPSTYHGVFATHPDNDQRLQEVVGAAQGMQPAGRHQPPRREAYLQRMDGVPFGPSAREGVLRGNRFFHLDLDFGLTFPAGWLVENRPDRLVAKAPGGSALLQVVVEDRNKRIGPEAFLRQRLERDRLAEGMPVRPAGREGYTAVTPLETPFGRRQARVGVV